MLFFFFKCSMAFFPPCFWFEFDFWCYCVFHWSEEDIFRWVLFHKCFILKSIFNSSLFFFFSRFMKQVRKDLNNASDNFTLQNLSDADATQKWAQKKKMCKSTLILFCDICDAVKESGRCLMPEPLYLTPHVKALTPALNPQMSTSDSCEHACVGLFSVSL